MTSTATDRTIARLYRRGMSSRRVGDRVGLSGTTVLRRLRKMGVEPRGKSSQRRMGSVSTEGYAKWGHSYVHRIVCGAWHGPPPTPDHEVNHIDGDKLNNHPENLEWATRSENAQHAWDTGLRTCPTGFPGPKMTEDQVRWLRKGRASGRTYQSLADELPVSPSAVRHAARRMTWRHVE